MASMTTPLAGFGFQLKTPQELAAERQLQQRELLTGQGSGFSKLGAVFGLLARKGVDKIAGPKMDPEMQRALAGQQVLGNYGRVRDELLDAGQSPFEAETLALKDAASQFRQAGLMEQAAELDARVYQMRVQEEVRLAEMEKLRAQADQAAAGADLNRGKLKDLGQGAPSELERLAGQRERLYAQMEGVQGPAAKAAIQRQLDALDGRIAKLNAITGRTPEDVGNSSVPLTKPEMTNLQEELRANQTGLDYLNNFIQNYDPALDLGLYANKAKYEALQVGAKAGLLNPDQQRWLAAANRQQQTVQTVYNAEVKRLSGSAVSAHEQTRVDKQEMVETDPPETKQAKALAIRAYKSAHSRRLVAGMADNNALAAGQPIEVFMTEEERAAWNWEASGGTAGPGARSPAAAQRDLSQASEDELDAMLPKAGR